MRSREIGSRQLNGPALCRAVLNLPSQRGCDRSRSLEQPKPLDRTSKVSPSVHPSSRQSSHVVKTFAARPSRSSSSYNLMSRPCHVSVTSASHRDRRHVNDISASRRRCVGVTSASSQRHVGVTSVSRRCHCHSASLSVPTRKRYVRTCRACAMGAGLPYLPSEHTVPQRVGSVWRGHLLKAGCRVLYVSKCSTSVTKCSTSVSAGQGVNCYLCVHASRAHVTPTEHMCMHM